MDRNTVLAVTSLDSLFVFAESYLEGPLGLPNVFARDLRIFGGSSLVDPDGVKEGGRWSRVFLTK